MLNVCHNLYIIKVCIYQKTIWIFWGGMFKYAATSDKKDAIKSDALYGEIVKLFKTVTYMNDATTF